jgi:hypothetical protein
VPPSPNLLSTFTQTNQNHHAGSTDLTATSIYSHVVSSPCSLSSISNHSSFADYQSTNPTPSPARVNLDPAPLFRPRSLRWKEGGSTAEKKEDGQTEKKIENERRRKKKEKRPCGEEEEEEKLKRKKQRHGLRRPHGQRGKVNRSTQGAKPEMRKKN